MKPALAILGIGIIILGFFGLSRATWFGWVEVIIGVCALVAAAARSKYEAYSGVALGVATLLLWVIALATGLAPWLTWLTFVFGVAFVLSSPVVTRTTLPPGRGPGPTFPPQ
jgi:hypothetical protein